MSFECYHCLPRAAWKSYKFTSPIYKTPIVESIEIRWLKESAKSVSKQIIENQGALESSWIILVRIKDVLTEVLGSLE